MGRGDLAAPARRVRPFYGPGPREAYLCARLLPPLPAGPRLGEASRAAWAGGGWVVAGREAPGPGSAVAAVAARVRPAGPEPAQAAGLAARPRIGPGSRLLLCRPVRTRQRRPPHGRVLGPQPCGGYPPAARPLIPANAAAAAAAVWAMD